MKVLNIFLIVSLLLILGIGGLMLTPHYLSYQSLKADLAASEKQLAAQKQEIMQLRQEIENLRGDRREIERVAREKFGWCRDGEMIYHFDSSGNLGPGTATAPRPAAP
jgi:cell division protein FtsB